MDSRPPVSDRQLLENLLQQLEAIKPIMVRVSKTSLLRVPVYPADEIDRVVYAAKLEIKK